MTGTIAKKALGVIPARLGSSRFPGKPLAEFFGRAMVEHTYEAAARAALLEKVVVASDSERVLAVIDRVGGGTVLTGACATGTDRIVQALHLMGDEELDKYDIVVNIQGDEPGVNPKHIDQCVAALRNEPPETVMSTLATPIEDEREALSRDVVKCVADRNGYVLEHPSMLLVSQLNLTICRNALYFSRALIPHSKDGTFTPLQHTYLRHVGMYAFRKDFLLEFPSLPPSDLEQAEDLEQLRALSAGFKIRLVQVESTLPGVDTEADLAHLKARWPHSPSP